MASSKPPGSPEFSDEQKALIDLVLALRKANIQEFLRQAELPISGTKEQLRERLQDALGDGRLAHSELVELLDSLAPWGKQHVRLYDGPRGDLQLWKNPDNTHSLLKQHRLGKLFNSRLPLVLPEKLTLSSVTHADGRLRVTAIQKREYWNRKPELDEERETAEGVKIVLKAYVYYLTRTLVAFEWDLNANVAMLQITQLGRDGDYEKVADEFVQFVGSWLDITQFGLVSLRPAIRALHERERTGQAEVRSHGVDYLSLQNTRVAVRSASPRHSVVGEEHIDKGMEEVRKGTVGNLGNFYWLPKKKPGPAENPLKDEVHAIMVGAKSRVNFPTPNTEDVVRYVVHRVRALSRTTP